MSAPRRRQSVSLKPEPHKQRTMKPYIIPFEQLKNKDVELVGGKNASIGEMISGLANLGVSVPGGFATTSHAYRDFLAQDGLDERIRGVFAAFDVDDVGRLARLA